MRYTTRYLKFWKLVSSLCVGWLMTNAICEAQVYESSAPLCRPWSDMELQNPAAGTYGDFSCTSSPLTMKYGASPRPDAEAEFLAFTMRNHLLATDADYVRIKRDLSNIRQLYPIMQGIEYFGDYVEGELIVTLITPLSPLISAELYDETNILMGLCGEDRFASFEGFDVATLSFPGRMNMSVLADFYHPDLMPNLNSFSSPNDICGLEDYIRVFGSAESTGLLAPEVQTTFRYEFEDGWLNCLDGCDCKEINTYETVDSGEVTFISSVFIFPYGWEEICMETRPELTPTREITKKTPVLYRQNQGSLN